jgi:hypothetical protein
MHVPSVWKRSVIVPVPKKESIDELNDFRPIAMTSILMKCFGKLMKNRLRMQIPHDLDPHQFAYKNKRSIEDVLCITNHEILKHLEQKKTYARILFLDYSSAFNTIVPSILHKKMINIGIQPRICNWYSDFLTDRYQTVNYQNILSDPIKTSVVSPQGCVSSDLLFCLYTHDCNLSL